MRVFLLVCFFAFCCAQGRSLNSVRKDAFTVGVKKGDSERESDFISEITRKMKIPRYRIVEFDDAAGGESLLLSGKVDVIISGVSRAPNLGDKFLLSLPYRKVKMGVAVASESSILTAADLQGKKIAFIPNANSVEQARQIWPNAKLEAAVSMENAVWRLQNGEASAIFADREILIEMAKNNSMLVLSNILAENDIVALFSFGSKTLQEEFNKHLGKLPATDAHSLENPSKPSQTANAKAEISSKEKLEQIISNLERLKAELEQLSKELK